MGMEYKPLFELLTSGRFKAVRLSTSAVKRLLKETGFLRRLPAELGTRRVRCAEVLDWCLPVMDRLCAEPEEGWLKACYLELAHGLFPDPERGRLPDNAAQAMAFYLTVLRWFLDTEKSRCALDPLTDIPALSEEELAIIGDLANKYDVIILEDMAYLCISFVRTMQSPERFRMER